MDMQILVADLVCKLLELLSDLDRASETATHVSADGDAALGGSLPAVMWEEAHHVLDHTRRFTDLTGDPRDIVVVDVPLAMLHFLEHLGDPGSHLSFNERFHGLSFEGVDGIKKLLFEILWIEKAGSLVGHLLSPCPHGCGKIPFLGFEG
jgi:hypothetical protein